MGSGTGVPGSGPGVRGRVSGSGIEARGTRLSPAQAPPAPPRTAPEGGGLSPSMAGPAAAGLGKADRQDLPAASTEPTAAGERTGGRVGTSGSRLFQRRGALARGWAGPAGGGVAVVTAPAWVAAVRRL